MYTNCSTKSAKRGKCSKGTHYTSVRQTAQLPTVKKVGKRMFKKAQKTRYEIAGNCYSFSGYEPQARAFSEQAALRRSRCLLTTMRYVTASGGPVIVLVDIEGNPVLGIIGINENHYLPSCGQVVECKSALVDVI